MESLLQHLNLIIPVVLIAIGMSIGKKNELLHYNSIKMRENEFLPMPALTARWYDQERAQEAILVTGTVCISIDHFKKFIAGLINFFGGAIVSYESLVDRARREAILRMKENARGYDTIVNLRVETSTISGNAQSKNYIGSVEVIAYGTAIKYIK
jgi:uncharacterized protein YbjQ (UPF0145 family)